MKFLSFTPGHIIDSKWPGFEENTEEALEANGFRLVPNSETKATKTYLQGESHFVVLIDGREKLAVSVMAINDYIYFIRHYSSIAHILTEALLRELVSRATTVKLLGAGNPQEIKYPPGFFE
jgi:hypothetical protein